MDRQGTYTEAQECMQLVGQLGLEFDETIVGHLMRLEGAASPQPSLNTNNRRLKSHLYPRPQARAICTHVEIDREARAKPGLSFCPTFHHLHKILVGSHPTPALIHTAL